MINYLNLLSGGLDKHWIYGDKLHYELACDYIQKINYSISDYNYTIEHIKGRGDVCFLIILAAWIQEACDQIEKIILEDVKNSFVYEDELFDSAKRYLRALRSFVVAHPLDTNRHPRYGLDGEYICVDISTGPIETILKVMRPQNSFYYLSIEGLKKVSSLDEYDYRLSVYSQRNNAEFFKYFGCNYSDIELVVDVYLKRILALDKYLSKQKRKDYIKFLKR